MKNASFLKASCAVLLAVMVLLGCALPAFAEAEHDPDALVWESEAETAGEVKATRTYLLQNAMDSVVTELYVYPSDSGSRGENLAGDGLESGESVEVTVTGICFAPRMRPSTPSNMSSETNCMAIAACMLRICCSRLRSIWSVWTV